MTMHVEDGALVRYLDEQCRRDERDAVRQHIGACAPCAGRLATLEHRSHALRVALRASDPAPRLARRRSPWALRAAAAILVLLAIGGAVRPVRAWILERAEALWSALTGSSDAGPLTAVTAETSVSFVPADGRFTVELSARQATGSLSLVGVPGDTARATVLGGSGAESLVVLPAALRIVNPPASAAHYRLALPMRLGPVRVVVGGEAPRVFDPGGPPLEIEVGSR